VDRLLFSAILLAATLPPQQPPFRAANSTVAVYATVRNTAGRLVPNLQREDFEVSDDGEPVELTVFSNEPQPITVAMLLDVSASMTGKILNVRDATASFIDALLPGDRVRIGTFGGREVGLSPLLTGDKAVLRRIVNEEIWPSAGQTPMWTAIDRGMTSLQTEAGRRVVLVLSDGLDSGSMRAEIASLRARAAAIAGGHMIYAVVYPLPLTAQPPTSQPTSRRELTSLASETGGGYLALSSDDGLASTFAAVAEELRHQYTLGFTPRLADGKTHSIRVRLKKPGVSARARRSYIAVNK
jgi:VWFA-related protein